MECTTGQTACHGHAHLGSAADLGALLLNPLGDKHRAEARPYLRRMETECIDAIVVEAYELIEEV